MARLQYLQASKVRRYMKENGMRVSRVYLEAMDREVIALMEKHRRTAVSDRRKTVMAIDIDLPRVVASLSRDLHR